jgi:tetratricopeptide (TPR) repeat protein
MAQQAEKAKQEAEKAKQDLAAAARDLEHAQRRQTDEASVRAAREIEEKLKEMQFKVQEALAKADRGRELALYARGTEALDQARYEKALQAFAEAAALKGSRADGALYWKAFAEYKQAAMQAALDSLKQIQEAFPHSRWVEQARALELEVRHASGEALSPAATPDEELKLLALNGLLRTDAQQALPMLEKMVSGAQPPRLKRRALFVLSQSSAPRAREILTAVAKESPDPELRLEAIEYLQLTGGAEGKKLLSDLYVASKDRDVKGRLVDSLFVQGDAKALVDLARKETDVAMRRRIVERLSVMRSKEATDYMMELINK